ncbi:hypothetical protein ABW19_dt0201518 [Dactylella cylindrospora]|nr:hypothetical protein ABW19_dt0201518 [Dactylella cylindrospora]
MFAVPGFSSLSSASLKSSFGKPSSGRDGGSGFDARAITSNVDASNTSSSKPNNRKRKRSQISEKDATIDVSADNIGELWSAVFEGKTYPSTKLVEKSTEVIRSSSNERIGKKDKKEKKKRKHDEQSIKKGNDDKSEHEGPLVVSNGERKSTEGQSGPHDDRSDGVKARMKNDPKRNNSNKTGRRDEKQNNKEHSKQDSKQKQSGKDDPFAAALSATLAADNAVDTQPKAPTLTPLQEKMRQKLSGARFRHLNQLLYTTPSPESLALFASQPEMFRDYHAGFRQQVESWPENPVDIYIKRIFARGRLRDSGFRSGKHKSNVVSSANANPLGTDGFHDAMESTPLPRSRDGFTTVIDLGCGEAALAKAITSAKPRPKIKIHSYDLHSPNPLVTVADIANLPLEDNSVDVAVFCLALMGTNWPKMIEEAVRVLRFGGEVWIAEIKSRFARTKADRKEGDAGKVGKKGKGKKNSSRSIEDDSNPADAFVEERDDGADQNRWATGEQNFIEALGRRGLRLKNRNGSNKMFVLLDFEKVGRKAGSAFQIPPKPDMHGRISKKFHTEETAEVDEGTILQPCLYKIR